MLIYKGSTRRQVGGNLFSTAVRGLRPLLLQLLQRMKPLAIKTTKSVGKRAAKAALNVGTDMAGHLLTGRLNKLSAKGIIDNELTNIKSDAVNAAKGYKRKAEEALLQQRGSGAKRHRKDSPNQMSKRKTSSKRNSAKKSPKKPIKKSINNRKKKKKNQKRKNTTLKKVFVNDILGK